MAGNGSNSASRFKPYLDWNVFSPGTRAPNPRHIAKNMNQGAKNLSQNSERKTWGQPPLMSATGVYSTPLRRLPLQQNRQDRQSSTQVVLFQCWHAPSDGNRNCVLKQGAGDRVSSHPMTACGATSDIAAEESDYGYPSQRKEQLSCSLQGMDLLGRLHRHACS